jgi:hypothetical protein
MEKIDENFHAFQSQATGNNNNNSDKTSQTTEGSIPMYCTLLNEIF